MTLSLSEPSKNPNLASTLLKPLENSLRNDPKYPTQEKKRNMHMQS